MNYSVWLPATISGKSCVGQDTLAQLGKMKASLGQQDRTFIFESQPAILKVFKVYAN